MNNWAISSLTVSRLPWGAFYTWCRGRHFFPSLLKNVLKRSILRNLGEHRQAVALWQHVHRYQWPLSLPSERCIVFSSVCSCTLGSSTPCAEVSCKRPRSQSLSLIIWGIEKSTFWQWHSFERILALFQILESFKLSLLFGNDYFRRKAFGCPTLIYGFTFWGLISLAKSNQTNCCQTLLIECRYVSQTFQLCALIPLFYVVLFNGEWQKSMRTRDVFVQGAESV